MPDPDTRATDGTQPKASAPYDYKHNVETCACGTCHKARVDSGTADAYLKRCQENARGVQEKQQGVASAMSKATAAISAAAAKSGGIDKPDFAKNLFDAMGTPHDSTCPHGLPFYACMPCSH